jgi:hypothetical protein
MRVRYATDLICVELSPAEARVLLDELSHVRGGARLPKLRQVCAGLEALFTLVAPTKPTPNPNARRHRSKTISVGHGGEDQ